MILHPPAVESSIFNWDGNMFTQEASTLAGNGFKLGRVYDDAADEGFSMISAKTGRVVVFARHHTEYSTDRELLWEDFISVTPGHRGIIARIWND